MKIALIGYGKMGRIIEQIAVERGHQIVAIVDIDSQDIFSSMEFASADVAIEFTAPSQAIDNFRKAWSAGVPVVSGTTGWTDQLDSVKEEVTQRDATLFWASNFSIGVNLLSQINRRLAELINSYPNYDVYMTEVHHAEKKDAPSGTAITLANDIIERLDNKECWGLEGRDEIAPKTLPIKAIREEQVPGTHIISYESDVDAISIKHEAKSRAGFALGAVVAAEYAYNKRGFLTMSDLINNK
ncbi:MAG: 4-hydroxy-tetrahydrodipicolinate reductase [bacterium]